MKMLAKWLLTVFVLGEIAWCKRFVSYEPLESFKFIFHLKIYFFANVKDGLKDNNESQIPKNLVYHKSECY